MRDGLRVLHSATSSSSGASSAQKVLMACPHIERSLLHLVFYSHTRGSPSVQTVKGTVSESRMTAPHLLPVWRAL